MKHHRENVAVLGSTGSIGRSTLEVAAHLKTRFRIMALAAGSNVPLLIKQVEAFEPEIVSLRTEKDADEFRRLHKGKKVRVTSGPEGAAEVASQPGNDIVISAITGIEGLAPTLAAVKTGGKIALANKESMVVAGEFIMREAALSGARIVPVDSEHSGIYQCLAGVDRDRVSRVTLTASGGPFFRTPEADIGTKTLEDTLLHPRWKMGKKVTVDSATLMNKGLELVEARWLFDLEPEKLNILIHPQSIVHAMVEMRDGSVLAQLSRTDMKIPIQYALTCPEREASPLAPLDLSQIETLEFYRVDERRFPLVGLARKALIEGGSYPVALNAANEAVVEAFLDRRIRFADIAGLVAACVGDHAARPVRNLADVYAVDRDARDRAGKILEQRT